MQKSTSIDTYALEFFLSLMETRSLAASADDFAVSSATAQRMLQKLRAHFFRSALHARRLRDAPDGES